ncbi:MAG: hypothetical protein JNL74_11440 [Fibrobacteres bacterium]|nr:hypothetical protein [Fibrobacterota bacterium]
MKISILTGNIKLIDEQFAEKLRAFGEVVWYKNSKDLSVDELKKILSESEIAITGWASPMLPAHENGWKLKYICHITGELKRIMPPSYFTPDSSVKVTNWGDDFSFATAEGAVALLFSVLKMIPDLDALIRKDGNADNRKIGLCTLHKTRVGIYGLSTIGRLVAEYLKPFNPIISYYDPTVKVCPEGLTCCKTLEELFSSNDIITIHAGLNDYTRGTVNYKLLSMLPQDGIIINTARGPIVVEEELGKILHEGNLRAGIDVSAFEADFNSSPYAATPNTILTGHAMSFIGKMERIALQEISHLNITRFVNKEPLKHIVSPEKYKLMT